MSVPTVLPSALVHQQSIECHRVGLDTTAKAWPDGWGLSRLGTSHTATQALLAYRGLGCHCRSKRKQTSACSMYYSPLVGTCRLINRQSGHLICQDALLRYCGQTCTLGVTLFHTSINFDLPKRDKTKTQTQMQKRTTCTLRLGGTRSCSRPLDPPVAPA